MQFAIFPSKAIEFYLQRLLHCVGNYLGVSPGKIKFGIASKTPRGSQYIRAMTVIVKKPIPFIALENSNVICFRCRYHKSSSLIAGRTNSTPA